MKTLSLVVIILIWTALLGAVVLVWKRKKPVTTEPESLQDWLDLRQTMIRAGSRHNDPR